MQWNDSHCDNNKFVLYAHGDQLYGGVIAHMYFYSHLLKKVFKKTKIKKLKKYIYIY